MKTVVAVKTIHAVDMFTRLPQKFHHPNHKNRCKLSANYPRKQQLPSIASYIVHPIPLTEKKILHLAHKT